MGPEKSQSWDIAVEQNLFQNRLFLSAGWYWNRFSNLILSVFDPTGCAGLSTFGFCAQNVGSAVAKGAEANFKYTFPANLLFLRLFELQGQYTFTLTRDLETGARLPRWPVHMASALLTYQPIDPIGHDALVPLCGFSV